MADRLTVDMIVNAISQGFSKVNKDIEGLGDSFGAASVKSQLAANTSAKYDSAVKKLAQNVEAGRITQDQASAAAQRYADRLGLTQQAAIKTASRMDVLKGAMTTVATTAGIVSVAVIGAWKAMTAGAELDAAKRQFDNLAESIGTSGSQLQEELRVAGRGMMTNAETITAASDIINTGLADTKDEAVFLTTAVSRLGLNMNQLTQTLLNDSTMRLDALKLSAERVKQIQDDLKASGATGDLFDQAVFIALQEKMDLLGPAADTAAGGMERFKNRLIDGKDAILQFIGTSTGPAFNKLADYLDDVQARQGDLNDAVRLGIVTQDEANTILRLANRGYDEWERRLAEVRAEVERLNPQLEKTNELQDALNYAAENSVSTYDDIVAMEERAAKARQMQTWMLQREEEQQRALGDALSGGALAFQENLDANRQAAAMAEAYTRQVKAQHDALLLTNEEQERLNALTGDYFTSAVSDGADALVSFNRTVTTTGGLTGEQRANLDELTSAYERTQANIRSLQGGTAGLGLTEEELNKKLEEQYNQLGLLQGPMEALQGVTAEVTGVNEAYTYNQDAINQSLYAAADAAGASANELAILGLATGQLSEEQAIAALKAAALQGKIEELGTAIANGMDPQVAINNLQTFQAHLDAQDFRVRIELDAEPVQKDSGKIKEAVQPVLDDTKAAVGDLGLEFVTMQETATGQFVALNDTMMVSKTEYLDPVLGTVRDLKNDLSALPTDIVIKVRYETSGTPPSAGGSTSGGGNGAPAGSYATGGVVPGPIGRPQLAVVHGGEEVLTPSQRQGRGNITISFAGAVFQGTTAETAGKIAETVAAKIGRL